MSNRVASFAIVALSALQGVPEAFANPEAGKLRQYMYSLELQEKIAKKQEAEQFHAMLRTANDPNAKILPALALGIHYLSLNPKLSAQYFAMAQTLADKEDPVHQLARYYSAWIRVEHGQYQETLAELKNIANEAQDQNVKRAARELYAQNLFKLGRTAEFISEYESYITETPAGKRSEELMVSAVSAYQKAGSHESYFRTLEALTQNFPIGDASKWALRQLLDHNQKKEYAFALEYLRRLNRYADVDAGLKGQLMALLENADVKLKSGEVKSLSPFERIQALVRVREYAKALDLAKELMENDNLSRDAQLALTAWLARLHHSNGMYQEAADYYEEYIAETGTRGTPNLNILEGQARNLSKMGEYKAAADRFSEIAKITASRTMKWQEFWNRYLAGDYERTMAIIKGTNNIVTHDPFEPMVEPYWQGKILLRKGRTADAMAIFQKVIKDQPESYYASVLRSQYPTLAAQEPSLIEKPKTAVAPLGSPNAAETATVSQTNFVSLFADHLKDKPVQLAARNMVATKEFQPEPQLVGLAVQVVNENDPKRTSAWKAAYPLAFDNILSPMADILGMDKFIVLSIMRAESYYNPNATSPVGAKGLMQLMPYTALRIASQLDDNQFRMESLADPKVNIAYAAYYIKSLLTYYDNNYFLAIAAYNAGPTAVDNWLTNCGPCSVDEFVEAIPYEETRRYVKKVVRYYSQYRKIHEGKETLPGIPEIPAVRPSDMVMF